MSSTNRLVIFLSFLTLLNATSHLLQSRSLPTYLAACKQIVRLSTSNTDPMLHPLPAGTDDLASSLWLM